MNTPVAERVWALAESLAQQEGLEVVDTEFHCEGRGMVLRVYLDRAGGGSLEGGGVTLDELTRFSRQLGDLLDVHEVVTGRYTLEASSPGINRRLRLPAHFARYLGKRVRVRTTEPIGGRRVFVGVLQKVSNEGVIVGELPGEQFIRFDEMGQANYQHDFGGRS
jgi:ribosome maturation factor RimP